MPSLLTLEGLNVPEIICRSCARVRFSVDRVGLPGRTDLERVDQKIMGDIGTAALQHAINTQLGLTTASYDNIRTDEYRFRDPGWDLVIGDHLPEWLESSPTDIRRPPKTLVSVSVKCSRSPAADRTLGEVIQRRDFKILKYGSRIEQDLHSDIEVQIYYSLRASRITPDLGLPRGWVRAASGNLEAAEEIATSLQVHQRYKSPWFVGAATFRELIQWSESLDPSARAVSMRVGNRHQQIWSAPLRKLGRDFHELPALIEDVLESPFRPSPVVA